MLAHFDRIAEAPDAIPRVRVLILDLAVRGKLVEHDVADGSAARLRAQIRAERARLIANGTLRERHELPAADRDDVPFAIPDNWELVRLGEALVLFNGKAFKPTEWSRTGTPIVRIQNLNDPAAPYNYCADNVPERFHIRTGDLLISWSGTPGTSFGAHIWDRGPAVLNQHIFRAEMIGEAFDSQFLKLAVNSRLLELIDQAHGGVGLQHITKPRLEMLALTLPPIAEQQRIVGRVRDLMSLCDRVESEQKEREHRRDRLVAASLHRLTDTSDPESVRTHAHFHLQHLPRLTNRPEQIRHLRSAIVSLAVAGRLVHQDAAEGTAKELLEKIREENGSLETQRPRHARTAGTVDASVARFEIPASWQWVRLGAIASEFRYGTSMKCTPEPVGQPVLRIPNVAKGRIDITDLKYGNLSDREVSDPRLALGDILIVRSNGSLELVGRTAMVEEHCVGYCYAGYLVRVRTSPAYLSTHFLVLALNSPDVRDQIERPIRTTVGLKNVNSAELASLAIPLPPLAEQHRIIAKVNELLSLCDQLQSQLATTQTESRRLLEALLHEALSSSTLGNNRDDASTL